MGEVWAAVHAHQRRTVALKLLTDEAARDPKFRTAFRNEVRNSAQLDHPNIVAVWDYGEVTTSDAEEGRLAAGTPWLAMEMVDGGTLLPHCGVFDWRGVMDVVLGLLDALAHAHARGVVHRDIKPANVLLGRRQRAGLPLVVKLSDFGLAHAAEATEDDHFNGGTPAYMAPEQFDGRWRNYGPWTDLYSLGCTVFALISGAPPFGPSAGFEESRKLHAEGTVPALEPPFPVPAGFESWLRRLLEKDPARRYRRAADALFDFVQLGPPVGAAAPRPTKNRADLVTLQLHTLSTMMDLPRLETEEVGFTVGSAIARPPPLPVDWRDLDERRADRTVRAGLRLFGVRPVPLVGREEERDALWGALRRVRDADRVEVVALHGPSGMGKSRLAEWLTQRAHEVGSAIVLRATHGPVPGPRDGLAGMAQRFLRCEGLNRAQLQERVAALVGDGRDDEREALIELLSPGAGSVRFGSAEERHFAVWQLIRRATTERCVVLWLDDVHWGPDSLRFVRRLVEEGPGRQVLVVMTATDEALAARRDEYAVWEELRGHERVTTCHVGPLAPASRAALVEDVLGLAPELAARVEEVTAGNPLFAVQILGDWIERDLLEAGPAGFVARGGAALEIPRDLGDLWETRVERVLAHRSPEDARALELAAVLGTQVNRREWDGAADLLGIRARDGLVEALLDARLAHTGDGGFGFAFAHPRVVDVLVRRAERARRLESCHLACAGLLDERVSSLSTVPPGLTERLGRHLLGAGQAEEALAPLLQGIDERVNAGDYAIAEDLIALRELALELSGVEPSDLRWGLNQLAHFQIARRQGQVVAARSWLDAIEDDSLNHGWMGLAVRCRVLRARLNRQQGELDKAIRALTGAIEDAVAIRDPQLVADARYELGEVAAVMGQLERSEGWARAALADYSRLQDDVGQARCWQLLGEILKEAGRYPEARELLRRAERLFEAAGNRWGRASAFNSEGDAARHEGRFDEAEALYRRSGGLFRAIGSSSAIYPQYNHALTWIARGRVEDALPVVEKAMTHFSQLQDGIGLANAHLALAACSAVASRWSAWDEHLRQGIDRTAQIGAADEDTAWIAEVAGQRAAAAGQHRRARQAWVFARDTWSALDRTSRVRAVQDALDRQPAATSST